MKNFYPFSSGSPNKWIASLLSLSLSLMIWGSIVNTLHAQSLPFGIIIASTEEFAPDGEGYSLDATFNNILIGYDVTNYDIAYPFAKTEAAINCF